MAAPAKILIVDDERDLVDAYVRLLQRAGHICLAAFDANEAIQLIDAESPDLVITDLSLPDTSGIEIIRHVRAKSQTTPIIVMSGHNTPELNHAAHAAGANVIAPEARLDSRTSARDRRSARSVSGVFQKKRAQILHSDVASRVSKFVILPLALLALSG